MRVNGIRVKNMGRIVNIEDDVLSMTQENMPVGFAEDRYGVRSVSEVAGWGGFTHLIRLDWAAWGLLVTAY